MEFAARPDVGMPLTDQGRADAAPVYYEQGQVIGGGSSVNGQVALRGAAWAGDNAIAGVEISIDYGVTWSKAEVLRPSGESAGNPIRTKDGRVLYEHRVEARTSVVQNPALSEMNQMLRTVISNGTGGRAAVGGYDLAGKTGTTSDYKDAWFVGYTGGFVAAVWTGKDDNKPMRRVTGGTVPAEVWRGFMAAALPRLQVRPIPAGPAAQGLTADPIGDLLD